MNTCLKHQRQYDPAAGWCVYCGRPASGVVMRPQTPPPANPPRQWAGALCQSCGYYYVDTHICTGTPSWRWDTVTGKSNDLQVWLKDGAA